MIINGRGHWSWLLDTMMLNYPEILRAYSIVPAPDGFLLSRKLFNNNAEVIIIKRTSEKVYKVALFRGYIIEFTSCRKADDVCEFLQEKLTENKFKKE